MVLNNSMKYGIANPNMWCALVLVFFSVFFLTVEAKAQINCPEGPGWCSCVARSGMATNQWVAPTYNRLCGSRNTYQPPRIPYGADNCGGGKYCSAGTKCTSRGRCIPRSSTECGKYICVAGQACLSDGCYDNSTVDNCGNGQYCKDGSKCWRAPKGIPDLESGLRCESEERIRKLDEYVTNEREKQRAAAKEKKRKRTERLKKIRKEKEIKRISNLRNKGIALEEKYKKQNNISRDNQKKNLMASNRVKRQNTLKSNLSVKIGKLKNGPIVYPGDGYWKEVYRQSRKSTPSEKIIPTSPKTPPVQKFYSGPPKDNCPTILESHLTGKKMCDKDMVEIERKRKERLAGKSRREEFDKRLAEDRRNTFKNLIPKLPAKASKNEYTSWTRTLIRSEAKEATGIHTRPWRKCGPIINIGGPVRNRPPQIQTCNIYKKCRYMTWDHMNNSPVNNRECKGGESSECKGNWHCE